MNLAEFSKDSRAVVISMLCAVFCLTLLCALTVPHFGGADERLHLDYAWQLSHGKFPQFYDGAKLPLYRKPPPVQFVAHHPPLYYALQAPLARYFVDGKGDINAAATAARGVNICLGLLCTVALIWLGGVIDRGSLVYRIGVPALFCTFLPFVKVSSLIFNDALALLFAVLGIGISWRIVCEGPSRYLTWCLAAVSAFGMASRATHVGVVVIGFFAICLHYLCLQRLGVKRSLLRSLAPIVLVVGVVVLTVGWFYYRNYTLSGSWTRVAPQSWAIALKREYKDIYRVLSEVRMWIFPVVWPYGYLPFSLQWYFVAPVIAGLMTLFGFAIWRVRRALKIEQWLCGAVLVLAVVLAYSQQIVHATGYGAFNPRYLILVYLVLAICMVRALRELPPWLSTILMAFCLVCGLVGTAAWSVSKLSAGRGVPAASLERFITQVEVVHGVPMVLVWCCCLGVLGGLVALVVLWYREARRVALRAGAYCSPCEV
jgi:uncharacterized protein (DUF486 family)